MVAGDAALRRRGRLQPVAGQGSPILPPTYPGARNTDPPRHVYERRRIGDWEIWCVLVDSVQSQANRLEEALSSAIADGVPIPNLYVDFERSGLAGLSSISSLEAPHRVYDAILRDSLFDGQPLMESPLGLALAKASPADATALLEASPTALLFGAWHSTGQGGGLGAKFQRSLVSEIVAIGAVVDEQGDAPVTAGRRTGSRIDPLGVLRKVEVYKSERGWDVSAAAAGNRAKLSRPSEINHGNIAPSIEALGITCDYVDHSVVLSFAALRRLRFGGGGRDLAGRTLVAALGLLAIAEQDARGYSLRSRCDLVPDGPAPFEDVAHDGSASAVSLDVAGARALYRDAYASAAEAGFRFPEGPIRLVPQEKLVAIVRKSQELALSGAGGEGDPKGDG